MTEKTSLRSMLANENCLTSFAAARSMHQRFKSWRSLPIGIGRFDDTRGYFSSCRSLSIACRSTSSAKRL